MIFMNACTTGDRWTVSVYVKGHGAFKIIRNTRRMAWKDAWRQVVALFPLLPTLGNA